MGRKGGVGCERERGVGRERVVGERRRDREKEGVGERERERGREREQIILYFSWYSVHDFNSLNATAK